MSVEIKLRQKYRTGHTGRNKSRSNNNRAARPKQHLKGEKELAQKITEANRMARWIDFTRGPKTRWIPLSEWREDHPEK